MFLDLAFRGDARARGDARDRRFVLDEAARHRIAPELALQLWDRACADAVDAYGHYDAARATQRFLALLALDRRAPEIGRTTRVEAEHARDDAMPPPSEAASEIPTEASPETRRWRLGRFTRLDPARAFRHATRGPARELPYRSQLERVFGTSLANVRAYTGRHAALTALGAEAATHGEAISFGPASPDLHLVAHEVAHVLQHRRAATATKAVSTTGDAAEREAEAVADAVVQAGPHARLGVTAAPAAHIQLQWSRDLRARWLWIDDQTGDLYDEQTRTILREGTGVWQPVGGDELADILEEIGDTHVARLRLHVGGLTEQQARRIAALHEIYDAADLTTIAIAAVHQGIAVPLVVRIARAVAGALTPAVVIRLSTLSPYLDVDALILLANAIVQDGWPEVRLHQVVPALDAPIDVPALATIMTMYAAWPDVALCAFCNAVSCGAADLVRVLTLATVPHLAYDAVVMLAGLELPLDQLAPVVRAVLAGGDCRDLVQLVRELDALPVGDVLELATLLLVYDVEDLIYIGGRIDGGLPHARTIDVARRLHAPRLDGRQLCGLMSLHATRDDDALLALGNAAVAGQSLFKLVTLASEFHAIAADELVAYVAWSDQRSIDWDQTLLRALARLGVALGTARPLLGQVDAGPTTVAALARAIQHQACPVDTVVALCAQFDHDVIAKLLELYAGGYASLEVVSALARCATPRLSAQRIVDCARLAHAAPAHLVALLEAAAADWVDAILERLARHVGAGVASALIARLIAEVEDLDGPTLLGVLELHGTAECNAFDVLAPVARALRTGVAPLDELRRLINCASAAKLVQLLPLFAKPHYREPAVRLDVAKLAAQPIPLELVIDVCSANEMTNAAPLLLIYLVAPHYASRDVIQRFAALTHTGVSAADLYRLAAGTLLAIADLEVLLPLRAREIVNTIDAFIQFGACVVDVKLPAARAVAVVDACPALALDALLPVLRLHRFEACRDDLVLAPLAQLINAGAPLAVIEAMFTQVAKLSGAHCLALLPLLQLPPYQGVDAMVMVAKHVADRAVPPARVIAVLTAHPLAPAALNAVLDAHQLLAYQSDAALIALAGRVAGGVDPARLLRLLQALQALAPADFVGLLALNARYADDADIVALGTALAAIARSVADVVAMAMPGALGGAVIAALLQPALLGAVPPDEVAKLDPQHTAQFTDAMAGALIGAQLLRLPAPCLAALPPSGFAALQCLADLTPPQAQVITRAQLARIQQPQVAQLHPDRLADIPALVVARLPAARVADLSDGHVDAMLPAQLAALDATQFPQLDPARFAVLDQAQLAVLLPRHAASLDAPRFGQIQAALVHHLAPHTLSAVAPAVLAGIGAVSLGNLTAGHVRALDHAQLRALPPQAIADLQARAGDLDPGQLAALAAPQIRRLDANLGNTLTVAQITALSPEQFAALDPALITNLPQASLRALTSPQLLAMTQAQINQLQNGQLGHFLPPQRVVLLPRVSQAQAAVLAPPSPLNAPLNTLIAGPGGGNTVPSVPHAPVKRDLVAVGAVAGLGNVQIGALSLLEISQWTDQHVQNLGGNLAHFTAAQIAAIRPSTIWALQPAALNAFNGARVAALTPAQLAAFGANQINQIGHAALAQLHGHQVPWLSTACIAALDQPSTRWSRRSSPP